MGNRHAVRKGQQAIRELTRTMLDRTGNLPPLLGVFSAYAAPLVRNDLERELTVARLGMRSSAFALKDGNESMQTCGVCSGLRRF